jgi:hypothetical protein
MWNYNLKIAEHQTGDFMFEYNRNIRVIAKRSYLYTMVTYIQVAQASVPTTA